MATTPAPPTLPRQASAPEQDVLDRDPGAEAPPGRGRRGRSRPGNGSGGGGNGRRRGPQHRKTPARGRWIHRHPVWSTILAVLVVLIGWFGVSFGTALTDPSLGTSVSARAAEWFRMHGLAPIVNWAENKWYSAHQPRKGGKPPPGAIPNPGSTSTTLPATSTKVPHLPAPAPVVPPASPPLPGEGQWRPVGRTVDGLPTMYVTDVRPDAVHTSYVVGIAWMDTKLLSATLYSGSTIPGGGPYPYTAPIQPAQASTLVSAFNAGFLLPESNGGYYTNGQMQAPLVNGGASFVVYKNGSATVGAWGRDVTMTPDVASVRQNLVLLVDNGQAVANSSDANNSEWGATLGGNLAVWRSGLGVTANGALVYVGGPALDIQDLANLLVRAGAVRAMELDINTDWVNFSYYTPSTPTGAATPANGNTLVPDMTGGPDRYFESWWSRDFITMSARPPATSSNGSAASGSRRRSSSAAHTGSSASHSGR